MPVRDEFIGHVLELLGPLGRVDARRMFGGHGLYCDGLFFAIAHDGTLYLKADEDNRGDFERAGCDRFSYVRRGKRATLNFFRAPEQAMDTSEDLLPWARRALAAALRARASRKQAPEVITN